jgi:hypothetical protein
MKKFIQIALEILNNQGTLTISKVTADQITVQKSNPSRVSTNQVNPVIIMDKE